MSIFFTFLVEGAEVEGLSTHSANGRCSSVSSEGWIRLAKLKPYTSSQVHMVGSGLPLSRDAARCIARGGDARYTGGRDGGSARSVSGRDDATAAARL